MHRSHCRHHALQEEDASYIVVRETDVLAALS